MDPTKHISALYDACRPWTQDEWDEWFMAAAPMAKWRARIEELEDQLIQVEQERDELLEDLRSERLPAEEE